MQSFWDLLPASLWPTQAFIPPDEQAGVLQALQALQASANSSSPAAIAPDNRAGAPWTRTPSPVGPASGGEDLSAISAATGPRAATNLAPTDSGAPGGILGAIFGAAANRPPLPAAGEATPAPAWQAPPQSKYWQATHGIDTADTSGAGPNSYFVNRAFGLQGVPRFQFFPERVVRGLANSLEQFTTEDPWDPATGTFRPEAIEAATNLALATMAPGTAFRAAPVGSIGMGVRAARPPMAPSALTDAGRGARGRAAIQGVDVGESVSSPAVKASLTGQDHHGISKKIYNELEASESLAGFYRYRDRRFMTRAIDEDAHRGYQKWHRDLDDEIAAYIRARQGMTPDKFESYLRDRYAQPDLLARFPNGL